MADTAVLKWPDINKNFNRSTYDHTKILKVIYKKFKNSQISIKS